MTEGRRLKDYMKWGQAGPEGQDVCCKDARGLWPRYLEGDGHGSRELCAHVCPYSEFTSLFLSPMRSDVFGPHHSLVKENNPPMVSDANF